VAALINRSKREKVPQSRPCPGGKKKKKRLFINPKTLTSPVEKKGRKAHVRYEKKKKEKGGRIAIILSPVGASGPEDTGQGKKKAHHDVGTVPGHPRKKRGGEGSPRGAETDTSVIRGNPARKER